MRKLISWLSGLVKAEAVEDARAQDSSAKAGNREAQGQPAEPTDNVARLAPATAKKSGFTVDDVVEGGEDLAKNKILCVVTKVPPQYAVYITKSRVAVQFADDTTIADQQRKEMAGLNALRAQIDGLVDGWRTSRWSSYRAKARKYDLRVAGALTLCLDKDGETARLSLSDTKDDIVAERTSWGRFEYLIAASLVSLVAIALFFCIQRQLLPFKLPAGSLWLAARAGTVGAFFSIALAIQSRTVLTNLRRRDNVADAVLRIAIGTIAAGVLLLMIEAGVLPKFQIGDATFGGSLEWRVALIVGFLAGFSERLVPDLLAKSVSRDSEAPAKDDAAAEEKKSGSGAK